jgi:ribosomal protein L11 methyltransferase
MAKHIEIIIPFYDELLVPALEAIGFEGFMEEVDVLKAYIPEGNWDEQAFEQFALKHLSGEQREGLKRNELEERNWNEAWESSFEPVVIGDFCAIRADFHSPVAGVDQEIIITPKMSFGTGHHATTHLMVEYMESLPMEGASVVDFGTGTGVLAILASKQGAKEVWAVDNDTWSIENAHENVKRNDADVLLHLGDDLGGAPQADIILANINRHVLLAHMDELYRILKSPGLLLLSGILSEDEPILNEAAKASGFQAVSQKQRGNWLAQLWKK